MTYEIAIIGYEKMMHARGRLCALGLGLGRLTTKLVDGPLHRSPRYTIHVEISEALNAAIKSVEETLPNDPVDGSDRLELLIEIAIHMPLEKRR